MDLEKVYPKKIDAQFKEEAAKLRKTEKHLKELEERYRFLVENINSGIAIIQDRQLKFVNPHLVELSKYPIYELIDTPFGLYIHPDELPRVVNIYLRRMAGKDAPTRYESIVKDKDGRDIIVEFKASPITFKGKPADLVIVRDMTKHKQWEKIQASFHEISEAMSLSESLEEFYRSIHGIISDLISEGKNFHIALYDEATKTIDFPYFVDEYMENPGPQKLGKGLTEYVLRKAEPLVASLEVIVQLEKKGEIETLGLPYFDWLGVPLKIGERVIGVMAVQSYTEGVRYSEEEMNLLLGIANQVATAIARDQDKKRMLEAEERLLEFHHLIKKNIQLILEFLRLQSSRIRNIKMVEIHRVCENRVRAIGFIYEGLYRSGDPKKIDFSECINRMMSHLFTDYEAIKKDIRLKLEVEKTYFDLERAIPCGLIINELVTNSLKHAFTDGRKGMIVVKAQEDKSGKYRIMVKDTGICFPKKYYFKKTDTSGMHLVTDLVEQINGTIKLRRYKGTEFSIEF